MKLLIVNYHYIREIKTGQGIFPTTSSELITQIDLLSKKYNFISQKQLITYTSNNSFPDKDFCLLTFDDGLKEQLKAFEILMKKKIPAVFFVPTMPLITNKACMVHKFHYLMENMNTDLIFDSIFKIFPYSRLQFRDDSLERLASKKYIYDSIDWAKIKFFFNAILNKKEKHLLVNQLFHFLKVDEDSFAEQLYMDKDEVKKIAQADMLGSHCFSHEPLGEMSDFEINKELVDSKKFLSDISGSEISIISYPFGDKKAVTKKVIEIADNSYRLGITTNRGINSINEIYNKKLALKRVSTSDIIDGQYLN